MRWVIIDNFFEHAQQCFLNIRKECAKILQNCSEISAKILLNLNIFTKFDFILAPSVRFSLSFLAWNATSDIALLFIFQVNRTTVAMQYIEV